MPPKTLILVIFGFLFASGHGWRCHLCDSNEDGRCNDPFLYDNGRAKTNDFEMDCSSGMKERGYELPERETWSYCVKMKSQGSVIRMCGWDMNKINTECYETTRNGNEATLCTCKDSYLCNKADRFNLSMLLILALVTVLHLFKLC